MSCDMRSHTGRCGATSGRSRCGRLPTRSATSTRAKRSGSCSTRGSARPRPHPPSPSLALALTFTLALAPTLGLTFEPNRSPSPKPEQVHPASRNEMVELKFTEPVKLRPGQSCGLYVHSALPGDEAIVYDNQRSRFTYQDRCFKVM